VEASRDLEGLAEDRLAARQGRVSLEQIDDRSWYLGVLASVLFQFVHYLVLLERSA
jgi:hypothetical protein